MVRGLNRVRTRLAALLAARDGNAAMEFSLAAPVLTIMLVKACFVMVMDSITINGTGDVLSGNTPANCSAAGVNLPYATIPGRGQLVS